MRRHRHAKIVATLGPASSSRSHPGPVRRRAPTFFVSISATAATRTTGSALRYRARYRTGTGRPIAVLADLQGPKLRLGTLRRRAFDAEDGRASASISTRRRATRPRAAAASRDLRGAVTGVHLLIDDGKVRLESRAGRPAISRHRGPDGRALSERKGVNVVGAVLPVSPLTEKDRRDLTSGSSSGSIGWRCRSCSGRKIWTKPRLVGGRAGSWPS